MSHLSSSVFAQANVTRSLLLLACVLLPPPLPSSVLRTAPSGERTGVPDAPLSTAHSALAPSEAVSLGAGAPLPLPVFATAAIATIIAPGPRVAAASILLLLLPGTSAQTLAPQPRPGGDDVALAQNASSAAAAPEKNASLAVAVTADTTPPPPLPPPPTIAVHTNLTVVALIILLVALLVVIGLVARRCCCYVTAIYSDLEAAAAKAAAAEAAGRSIALSVAVSGWGEEQGGAGGKEKHAVYTLETVASCVAADSGAPVTHTCTTQRRYNEFVTLHAQLAQPLGLPAAFPVSEPSFLGDEQPTNLGSLEAYLRRAVEAAGEAPPPQLCAFLCVDTAKLRGAAMATAEAERPATEGMLSKVTGLLSNMKRGGVAIKLLDGLYETQEPPAAPRPDGCYSASHQSGGRGTGDWDEDYRADRRCFRGVGLLLLLLLGVLLLATAIYFACVGAASAGVDTVLYAGAVLYVSTVLFVGTELYHRKAATTKAIDEACREMQRNRTGSYSDPRGCGPCTYVCFFIVTIVGMLSGLLDRWLGACGGGDTEVGGGLLDLACIWRQLLLALPGAACCCCCCLCELVFAGIMLYIGTVQYIGTVLYLVGTVRDVSIAFYVVLFIAAVLAMRK